MRGACRGLYEGDDGSIVSHHWQPTRVYYYGCVALKERQVRYVPWAKGSAWRTARAAEQPELYWTCVALLMGLSVVILAGALVNAARGLS